MGRFEPARPRLGTEIEVDHDIQAISKLADIQDPSSQGTHRPKAVVLHAPSYDFYFGNIDIGGLV